MNHRYESDPSRTAKRIALYDAYMRDNVLAPDGSFVCTSRHACWNAARAANPGCSYYEGQLGYIGNHYDLSVDGVPWRMLFVGMELGGSMNPPRRIDRQTRSAHHHLATKPEKRNPHMNGVVLALQYALGLLPHLPAPERLNLHSTSDHPVHVLDCYALINARLCSATTAPGGRRSAGVQQMTRNCLTHLNAAISILEPTLVVIQSKTVWSDLTSVMRGTDVESGVVHLRRIQTPRPTLIAHLSHPTSKNYSWQSQDDQYFWDEVVPTIRAAVEMTVAETRTRN